MSVNFGMVFNSFTIFKNASRKLNIMKPSQLHSLEYLRQNFWMRNLSKISIPQLSNINPSKPILNESDYHTIIDIDTPIENDFIDRLSTFKRKKKKIKKDRKRTIRKRIKRKTIRKQNRIGIP